MLTHEILQRRKVPLRIPRPCDTTWRGAVESNQRCPIATPPSLRMTVRCASTGEECPARIYDVRNRRPPLKCGGGRSGGIRIRVRPARRSDGSYAGVEDGRDDGVEAESGVHEPSACVRGLEFCYYSLAWC